MGDMFPSCASACPEWASWVEPDCSTPRSSSPDRPSRGRAAKPVVTKVVATHGSTNGGTVVTVTGKNFTKVSAVKFGSIKGAHVKVVSSEKVTVTSPKHTAGVVHVRIVTKAGTSAAVKTDHFTYATPPSVTKISPTRGLVKGGTKVTVTGKNFAGAPRSPLGRRRSTIGCPAAKSS